jgi:hypothetical protein
MPYNPDDIDNTRALGSAEKSPKRVLRQQIQCAYRNSIDRIGSVKMWDMIPCCLEGGGGRTDLGLLMH